VEGPPNKVGYPGRNIFSFFAKLRRRFAVKACEMKCSLQWPALDRTPHPGARPARPPPLPNSGPARRRLSRSQRGKDGPRRATRALGAGGFVQRGTRRGTGALPQPRLLQDKNLSASPTRNQTRSLPDRPPLT
jgi:hypothetical protein